MTTTMYSYIVKKERKKENQDIGLGRQLCWQSSLGPEFGPLANLVLGEAETEDPWDLFS